MQHQSSAFRTWHRWLSLIVGVQMVIWAISGAYMVLVQLPFIHGEHLTQEADGELNDPSLVSRLPAVLRQYPEVDDAHLVNRTVDGQARDMAQLHVGSDKFMLDLETLEPINLTQADIRDLAAAYYAKGEPVISSVEYLEHTAPGELSESYLPIWRINFDDFGNTSLYLHPETGEMTVRRHDFWRGFDIMWMLHIMDYDERVDITTWWLRAFIFATFAFLFTGTVLLLQTIWASRRQSA
jgi:uncharacterized iron-regulated membrane protein